MPDSCRDTPKQKSVLVDNGLEKEFPFKDLDFGHPKVLSIYLKYCMYLSCIYLVMLYLLSTLDFFHLATTDLEPSAQLRAGQAPSVNMEIWDTCRHESPKSPAFEHQCYPVVQPTLVEARPNLSKMTRISVSLGNKPTQSNPGREAARDLLQLLQLFT